MAFRDARASPGLSALVVFSMSAGVAGMCGMEMVASALSNHVASNARQWIAADISVRSDEPPTREEWEAIHAIDPGLRATLVSELPAMAASDSAPDAVAVRLKAVDPRTYPFYGAVILRAGGRLDSILNADSAVVSPDLLEALQLREGMTLRIRDGVFQVSGVIAAEPDRYAGPYSPAPRVLVSREGLDRTGLLRFDDRGYHRVLIRAPAAGNIGEMCRRLEQVFPNSDIADSAWPLPVSTVAADLVVPFCRIVAIIALAFGAWAVATIAYLHLLRRIDTIAILKSLGATASQIEAIYLLQVLTLVLAGSTIGLAAGSLVKIVCARMLEGGLGIPLAYDTHLGSITRSLCLAFLAAGAAGAASLRATRSVSPALLLRRDAGDKAAVQPAVSGRSRPTASALCWIVLPAILLFSIGDSWQTRMHILAAIAGGLGLLLLCSRGAIALVRRGLLLAAARRLPFTLRYGLSNLHRWSRQTRAALPLLAAAVALIVIAREGERRVWDGVVDSLPFRAPNLLMFKLDIRQTREIPDILREQARITSPLILLPTTWLTLVRAGNSDLESLRLSQSRAWVPRNWYATCSDLTPSGLRVIAGHWWKAGAEGIPLALEENTAELLGAHLNTEIEFLASGKPLRAHVLALVRVPPVQRFWYRLTLGCHDFPGNQSARYSGGVGIGGDVARLGNLLQDRYRTATVVAVDDVKRKAERDGAEAGRILTVVAAVLACMGGAMLLATASVLSSYRVGEIATLRAIGASRWKVLGAILAEYLALGGLAGVLGAIFGSTAANMVLWYVTGKLVWLSDTGGAVVTAGLAALLSAAVGTAGSLDVLRRPPLDTLRRR
jgi:putative ABC transport system permease protein